MLDEATTEIMRTDTKQFEKPDKCNLRFRICLLIEDCLISCLNVGVWTWANKTQNKWSVFF